MESHYVRNEEDIEMTRGPRESGPSGDGGGAWTIPTVTYEPLNPVEVEGKPVGIAKQQNAIDHASKLLEKKEKQRKKYGEKLRS
jgi:hypothetical protein